MMAQDKNKKLTTEDEIKNLSDLDLNEELPRESDGEISGDECQCHCMRKKHRSPEEYKKLINRLNRIEGQIRGIRGMVEKSCYCPDILVQSAAATAAINAFNRELLANHIRTCVAEDIKGGHDETIDELVSLLKKFMK